MNSDTETVEPSRANDSDTTIMALREVVREFVDQRNWQRFHDPKNLSMAMAIEAAELMEHFQWITSEEVRACQSFDRSEVTRELADVICYAFALANTLGVDISQAVHDKMILNRKKYPV